MLSAEELLAGGSLTYDIEVPARLLGKEELAWAGTKSAARAGPPASATSATTTQATGGHAPSNGARTVRLRPLTVADLQLITRAAKENDALVGTLMVQRALVEPALTVAQAGAMPVGVLEFLLAEVMRISGIGLTEPTLRAAVEAPLAQAAHVLAREFGWTPPQVSELTFGQIMVHLQMLDRENRA